MNVEDYDKVGALIDRLKLADRTLAAFEQYEGETVPSSARISGNLDGFSRGKGVYVDLLPVPKHVAVSAARRAREKIAAELLALFVVVPPA